MDLALPQTSSLIAACWGIAMGAQRERAEENSGELGLRPKGFPATSFKFLNHTENEAVLASGLNWVRKHGSVEMLQSYLADCITREICYLDV